MDILLAKIIGLYFVIIAISLFVNKNYIENIVTAYSKPEFSLLAGTITLLLGLLLINIQHSWKPGADLILSLIAWIILIKGIILTCCPKVLQKLNKSMYQPKYIFINIAILVTLGLTLIYHGFF